MVLETKRLVIRPFRHEDEATAIALFTDPDFMVWSHLGGPLSPNGARAKLQTFVDLYQTYGFSKLALVAKNSGRVVGYCGFGLEPIAGPPAPEFGYRLHPDARGKGLATEAAQIVLADAFGRLKMPFVRAIVAEDNAPSRRVLEKLGMTYLRRVQFQEQEWLLYRLEAPTGSRDVGSRSVERLGSA